MRTTLLLAGLLTIGGTAAAQPAGTDAQDASAETLSVGVVLTPALEPTGPWLMPAVRISAALGSGHGIDVDAGRVLGGATKYGIFRSFAAVRVRHLRAGRNVHGDRRYWLAGLNYLPETDLDGEGHVQGRKPHLLVSLGHGWDHVYDNRSRLAFEIGITGAIAHVTFGFQWGLRR